MDSKSKAGDSLRVFCHEFGVPESLTYDSLKEQCGRTLNLRNKYVRMMLNIILQSLICINKILQRVLFLKYAVNGIGS